MVEDPIYVLCVDDNADLADILCRILDRQHGIHVLGAPHSGEEFLAAAATVRPCVAIVDISMPGAVNGLEAIAQASNKFPAVRSIAYSGYDDAAIRDHAAKAGAWGFVSKHRDAADLIAAVRTVAAGGVAFG